jgi:hypothetical protein
MKRLSLSDVYLPTSTCSWSPIEGTSVLKSLESTPVEPLIGSDLVVEQQIADYAQVVCKQRLGQLPQVWYGIHYIHR